MSYSVKQIGSLVTLLFEDLTCLDLSAKSVRLVHVFSSLQILLPLSFFLVCFFCRFLGLLKKICSVIIMGILGRTDLSSCDYLL